MRTERIKVVSVWSEFRDEDLPMRPRAGDPRGRSVQEQMVHQCVKRESVVYQHAGESTVSAPPLPATETRLEFMKRYARTAESGSRRCGRKTMFGGSLKRNSLMCSDPGHGWRFGESRTPRTIGANRWRC